MQPADGHKFYRTGFLQQTAGRRKEGEIFYCEGLLKNEITKISFALRLRFQESMTLQILSSASVAKTAKPLGDSDYMDFLWSH